MTPKILVLIAARGGSKGIKNKNLRPLLGRPLIAHTIRQALAWKKASRVIVSTDSEKIARTAKRFHAAVPFLRPATLARDLTPKGLVIQHAFKEAERIYEEKYDILVDLDVTAPIRKVSDLDACLKLFLKYKPPTLFSVTKPHKNPYFNMIELSRDGKVRICKQLRKKPRRRQDAPRVYSLNASIYFYSRKYLLESASAYPITPSSKIHVMGDYAAVDIDKESDFKFIEFLSKERLIRL